ncbi:Transmembrane protein 17 [Blattella germanica]|nr:Transmembrane protein 17 [Blattella germanica]
MSLYFKIYFFPIWLVTVLLILDLKYECLSHIYSFIVVTIFIGIKLLHLYIGCMGNLTETVISILFGVSIDITRSVLPYHHAMV